MKSSINPQIKSVIKTCHKKSINRHEIYRACRLIDPELTESRFELHYAHALSEIIREEIRNVNKNILNYCIPSSN